MEVLVFGGTSEGRDLVEWLAGRDVRVVACCATEYGGELVTGRDNVEVMIGPLSSEEKTRLVKEHDFKFIVDATHPFATHITESIAQLARDHDIELIRLVRKEQAIPSCATLVADANEAAREAASRAGNLLLTTGSKDLETFTRVIGDYRERLYVRVLPVPDSIARTRELDIPASHVIAMQGPFSEELNAALLHDLSIGTLVTKASGKAGGFNEKVDAAKRCGADIIVIGRPDAEAGLTSSQVKARFDALMNRPPLVYLVGMGPGTTRALTREAQEAIERSELVIGAQRLLDAVGPLACETSALVKADDIADALRRGNATVASVLFSGDVGFYSGATALAPKLDGFEVQAIPGVSSVAYFCAKLLVPWQDAHLVSSHGRESDPVAEVRSHAKTFFLTGGKTNVRCICTLLRDAGLGNVIISVGERLSYPDERITRGSAECLADREFAPLAVMLVENPAVDPVVPGKLEV